MTDILLSKIEATINRLLSLDPDVLVDLEDLSGKVICLEVLNINKAFYVFPGNQGFRLKKTHDGDVNVTVRGTPSNVFSYCLSTKNGSGTHGSEMEIVGDIGLAQDFQSIMKKVDLDWEEHLSHWIGDTPAHKLANVFKSSVKFVKKSKRTLELDMGEYLHNEKGPLPGQSEVDAYVSQIDNLRNDVDLLKARISKLHNAMLAEN